MGPRVGLDSLSRKQFFPFRERNPGPSASSSVLYRQSYPRHLVGYRHNINMRVDITRLIPLVTRRKHIPDATRTAQVCKFHILKQRIFLRISPESFRLATRFELYFLRLRFKDFATLSFPEIKVAFGGFKGMYCHQMASFFFTESTQKV
jgi:hypothetical protein